GQPLDRDAEDLVVVLQGGKHHPGERQQDQRRGDAQHDVEHRLLDGTTGAMPVRTVLRRCGVLGGTVEGERGHQASLRLLMRNWFTVTVMQIRNSTIATAEE